jgi:hypothetical protein
VLQISAVHRPKDSEIDAHGKGVGNCAIDVLDLLDNPNTSRALNYRGNATSKLGRTDEGIGYYLKSVTLDPNYPQVREYVGGLCHHGQL